MSQNPENVTDVLALVQKLLETGRPDEAVALVRRSANRSAEVNNAYGVALMRVGQFTRALEVYRALCLSGSGLDLKANIPTAYKLNYATALLLTTNVAGCIEVLNELAQGQHAYVQKLRAAIDRWRRSLGWWRRIAFDWYGITPAKPVTLDFPPGELENRAALRPVA